MLETWKPSTCKLIGTQRHDTRVIMIFTHIRSQQPQVGYCEMLLRPRSKEWDFDAQNGIAARIREILLRAWNYIEGLHP